MCKSKILSIFVILLSIAIMVIAIFSFLHSDSSDNWKLQLVMQGCGAIMLSMFGIRFLYLLNKLG